MTRAPERVQPHPPLRFDDGAVHSPLFGDVFKSRAGAFAESRAVFVDGCDVAARWRGRRCATVLEIGFGLGVNFLSTLMHWLDDDARSQRLVFVSIDKHPVAADDLRRALRTLANDGGEAARLAPLIDELVAQWPPPLPGLHRLRFAHGRVVLLLAFGDAQAMLPRLTVRADAVYLDGFAPARNPDAWAEPLMRAIARRCRPQARLSTYTAAAAVRRALQATGFDVERVAGFGGKRERIVATRRDVADPIPLEREPADAIVVGAGLAGCAIAAALAGRGWRVTLVDAADAPLPPASGSAQPWLAEHLHISPDDNPLARLTRAAWSLSRTASEATRATRRPTGRLMLALDDDGRRRQRDALVRLGWPSAFARWVDAGEAARLAGVDGLPGAIWWPGGAIVDPAERCRRLLAEAAGGRTGALGWLGGCTVAGIGRGDDGRWRILDADHRERAAASVLVLANAGHAPALAGLGSIALQPLAGQSTRLRTDALAALRCAIGGDAYVLPCGDGSVLTGTTHRSDPMTDGPLGGPLPVTDDDDAANLARLARLIGAAPATVVDRHVGWRFAARDHLPVIGPVHDEAAMLADPAPWQRNDRLPWPMRDRLFIACGFGGRGLLWSTLAAEAIAAMVDGEALPLEADLAAAISPGRLLRHRLRRGA